MAQLQVNPTRMELKKIQARYTTARRGHKLLKDKRDELMKKFLEVVREDKVLRERVEAALAQFRYCKRHRQSLDAQGSAHPSQKGGQAGRDL